MIVLIDDAGADLCTEDTKGQVLDLCESIRNVSVALPVLQTLSPIIPNGSPERIAHHLRFNSTIRRLASELEIPLIDHARHWQDAIARHPGCQYYWMGEESHPNTFGHRVFAEFIVKEISNGITVDTPSVAVV